MSKSNAQGVNSTLAETKPVTNPMEQLSQAFAGGSTFNESTGQLNAADFSTLQLMFQTTNYSNLA